MLKKYFPATNDVVFKKIFGDIKNKAIIKGFLSAVLEPILIDLKCRFFKNFFSK